MIYSAPPVGRCHIVTSGNVALLESRADGDGRIRLLLGRGTLFGERPFDDRAFDGFPRSVDEQAVAHGSVTLLTLERSELEQASRENPSLATLLIESANARAQFMERRLLWQFVPAARARVAAAVRDLVSFEGQRCRHGHSVDIRLTHQNLADLVGLARPVISAELARLRREGIINYTRVYLCVDDLIRLHQIASLAQS